MPDKLEILISGKTDPSVAAAAAAANQQIQSIVKESKKARDYFVADASTGSFFGPSIKSRFDGQEQAIRSEMAKTIRTIRDEARQANIRDEASIRLYGPRVAAADREEIDQTEILLQEMAARGEAQELEQAAVAERAAQAATFSGQLASLKETFGRGSDFAMTMRSLTLSGPLLALGLLARGIEDVSGAARKSLVDTEKFADSGQRFERSWGFLEPGSAIISGFQDMVAWTFKTAGASDELVAKAESATTAIEREAAATRELKKAQEELAQVHKNVSDIVNPIHEDAQFGGGNAFDHERFEAGRKLSESWAKIDDLESQRTEVIAQLNAMGPASVGENGARRHLRQSLNDENQRIIGEQQSLPDDAEKSYQTSIDDINSRQDKQKKDEEDRDREKQQQRIKSESDANAKMLEMRSRFYEGIFRLSGKSAQADIEVAKRERDQQIHDLPAPRLSSLSGIGASIAGSFGPGFDYAGKASEISEKAKQESQDKQIEAAHHQEQIDRSLHESRMSMLQAEASMGDKAAERRIKSEEAIERFKEKNLELQKMIDDPRTAPAQRAQLQAAQQDARATEFLSMLGDHSPSSARYAHANWDDRGTTGATAALRQRAPQDPNTQLLKQIQESINKMVASNGTSAQWNNLWQSLINYLPQLKAAQQGPTPLRF